MKLLKSEKGQGMIEYAVILSIVVAVVAVAINNKDTIVNAINLVFTNVVAQLGTINN